MIGNLFASSVPEPPQAGRYAVLYIDDPWPERGGGQVKRGADKHYDLQSIDSIFAFPFGDWAAPDAHCYMWVTNNYVEDGLRVLKHRRFRYVTMVTWVKDKIGLGQYYRGKTEHCLFGVRGRLPYLIDSDGGRRQGETVIFYPDDRRVDVEPAGLPSAFEAPHVRVDGKIKHSAKPPIMRDFIRTVSGGHGPMLECFARVAADGFDAWGNQAPE